MGTTKRTALLMVLCALGIGLGGGTARADGTPVGADIEVAQTLGARELTVIIRRIDVTPGDLHVDIATHAGTAPGSPHLAAAADGVMFSRGDVVLGATPGLYSGTVGVAASRAGASAAYSACSPRLRRCGPMRKSLPALGAVIGLLLSPPPCRPTRTSR
ncbi:hypothetical protein AB0F91_42165 [Amycolatopsis sp. NPDC023774]|uniref:hypothetical protein n=1 Tax=Amycolatopsis sp. NPDC023774 TaxID=3155015 RepID=UPI0033DC75A8